MYKHILVPTDGSTLSQKAARAAARLARQLKARVTAVYVIGPYSPPMGFEGTAWVPNFTEKEYLAGMRKHAAKAVDKVRKVMQGQKVRFDGISIVERSPWEGIVKAARAKKCDLVVMASHGRRGLAGVLIGSETTKVLTHSTVPVLVCR